VTEKRTRRLPALTNACPAAARTRVQARFFEDASLTRVSDVFELTKQAERVPDSGVETNRETNRHDWVPSFAPSLVAGAGGDTSDATRAASFVTTIRTSDSFFSDSSATAPLAVAAMSWWWMDVGARSMESGDGRADEMRDAVILSSAPDDAEANRRDRTVTFSPVAAPLALRREGRENREGRAPCVAARVSLSYTEAGRVAFFVDELLEGNETSETSFVRLRVRRALSVGRGARRALERRRRGDAARARHLGGSEPPLCGRRPGRFAGPFGWA
jgi:hypothetical protein